MYNLKYINKNALTLKGMILKFTAKTTEKVFFKFTLSDDWFDNNFDYKDITNIKVYSVTADVSDDHIVIVDNPSLDCKVSKMNITYEEDDWDKFIKVFCEVEFSISDDKFNSFPDELKETLRNDDLLVHVNSGGHADNNFEIWLGEFLYDAEIKPQLDEHYFFLSGYDQQILGDL